MTARGGALPRVGEVWWVAEDLVRELNWYHDRAKERPYLLVAFQPPPGIARPTGIWFVEGRSEDPRQPDRRAPEDPRMIVAAPREAGTRRQTHFLVAPGYHWRMRTAEFQRAREQGRVWSEGALPASRLGEIEQGVGASRIPVLKRIWASMPSSAGAAETATSRPPGCEVSQSPGDRG